MRNYIKNTIFFVIFCVVFAFNSVGVMAANYACDNTSEDYYDDTGFYGRRNDTLSNDGQRDIYDITNVEIKDDGRLYLFGYAFNTNIPTLLGDNATVQFQLHPTNGEADIPLDIAYSFEWESSCWGNGCSTPNATDGLYHGKYYDLTYWQCSRTGYGDLNEINSPGRCKAGDHYSAPLQGGFSASIKLNDSRILPNTEYIMQYKLVYNGYYPSYYGSKELSFIPNKSWKEFTFAKSVVVSDSYEDVNSGLAVISDASTNMKINFSGFGSHAQVVVPTGRVLSKSGFICNSSIINNAKKDEKFAYEHTFNKGTKYQITDVPGQTQWGCRGGRSTGFCPSGTNGKGSVRLYEISYGINNSSKKILSGTNYKAYVPASWIRFDGNITLKIEKQCDPSVSCCYTKGSDGKFVYNNTAIGEGSGLNRYKCKDGVALINGRCPGEEDPYSTNFENCDPETATSGCGPDEKGPYFNMYIFHKKIPARMVALAGRNIKRDFLQSDSATFNTTELFKSIGVTSQSQIRVLDGDSSLGLFGENSKNTVCDRDNINYIAYDCPSGFENLNNNNNDLSYKDILNKFVEASESTEKYVKVDRNLNAIREYSTFYIPQIIDEQRSYMNSLRNASKPSILKFQKNNFSEILGKIDYSSISQTTINIKYHVKVDDDTRLYAVPTAQDSNYIIVAVYKMAYCVKDSTTIPDDPVCGDDVTTSECAKTGNLAWFHEDSHDFACTLKQGNNSGFTIVNSSETNSYCEVACKDDIDLYLPGDKEVKAGSYFVLNNYTPKIKATRTCVTSKIDYGKFDGELKTIESRLPGEYNNFIDTREIYNHLHSVQTPPKPTIVFSSYNEEVLEGCTTNVSSISDCSAENKRRYIKETYKYKGVTYTYTAGCSDCYGNIKKSGTKKTDDAGEAQEDTDPKSYNERIDSDTSLTSEQKEIYKNLIVPPDNKDKTKEEKSIGSSSTNDIGSTNGAKLSGCWVGSDDDRTWKSYTYEKYTINSKSTTNRTTNLAGGTYTWTSNNYCVSGNTSYTFSEHIDYLKNTWKTNLENARKKYVDSMTDYTNKITSFNNCYSWTDKVSKTDFNSSGELNSDITFSIVPNKSESNTGYYFDFNPQVEFKYTDKSNAFYPLSEGRYKFDYNKYDENDPDRKYVEKKGFNIQYFYWNKNSTANPKYDNFDTEFPKVENSKKNTTNIDGGPNIEPRKIIVCQGSTCRASSTQEMDFYQSSYVKKVEDVEYTYHLPTIYTIVPNGKTYQWDDSRLSNPKIKLERDAVPVNINTSVGGGHTYSIYVSKLEDDLRSGERYSTKINDSLQNSQSLNKRFVSKRTLNQSESHTCNYTVFNDVKEQFFYRTIDPNNIDPQDRYSKGTLGYNWAKEYEKLNKGIIGAIESTDTNYQTLTDNADDNYNTNVFEFVLTPSIMQAIRQYNKSPEVTMAGGYSDFTLDCSEPTPDGEDTKKAHYCKSKFLSCMAKAADPYGSIDPSCSNIFTTDVLRINTLKDYNKYTEYNLDKLEANRKKLIRRLPSAKVQGGEST